MAEVVGDEFDFRVITTDRDLSPARSTRHCWVGKTWSSNVGK